MKPSVTILRDSENLMAVDSEGARVRGLSGRLPDALELVKKHEQDYSIKYMIICEWKPYNRYVDRDTFFTLGDDGSDVGVCETCGD